MDLLPIYLRDHLAGATSGLELAKRLERENRDSEFGPPLTELRREIEEDRATVVEIMRRLNVTRDRLKEAAAWAGEKVGRLKLNGRLVGYSPLSRVIELEALEMGVTGKDGLWRSLIQARGDDRRLEGIDLAGLHARAESQRTRIRALQLRAAAIAFD
jgi:hypothetical protein